MPAGSAQWDLFCQLESALLQLGLSKMAAATPRGPYTEPEESIADQDTD